MRSSRSYLPGIRPLSMIHKFPSVCGSPMLESKAACLPGNCIRFRASMVFLTKEKAADLPLEQARKEALKYSNLCLANLAVIRILEKQVGRLVTELGASHQLVLDSQAQLETLRNRVFGRSSERRLGNEDLPLLDPTALAPANGQRDEEKAPPKKKRKREKFGRTEQPALPRTVIDHVLPAEQIAAGNLEKWENQFEISELITVEPTKFKIEEHRRQKYLVTAPVKAPDAAAAQAAEIAGGTPAEVKPAPASPEKKRPAIVTAPGPLKLKEGSRYSIEFGVDVGISKYSFHLPLDRQVRIARGQGLTVTSQALFAQVDTIAWYLKLNVIPGIRAKILESRVNLGDETYWENLGKKEKGKKRFWLWGVRNEKAVLFDVFDARSKKVAQKFLAGLRGVLLTDGYQVYRSLASESLVLANDWAHVRRKFLAAEKTHPVESKWFVEQIRALFAIEGQIKGRDLPVRRSVRLETSRPITEAIGSRLIELKKVLPQSPLGRAVNYTLNLWSGLTRFLEDPEIPLDTNSMESQFRPPVVGRKNHYGSKSLETAEVAASWYTTIATCETNGVDSRAYIDDTLRRILTGAPVLMPWEWKPLAPEAQPSQAPAGASEGSRGVVSETVVIETIPDAAADPPENGAMPASELVS